MELKKLNEELRKEKIAELERIKKDNEYQMKAALQRAEWDQEGDREGYLKSYELNRMSNLEIDDKLVELRGKPMYKGFPPKTPGYQPYHTSEDKLRYDFFVEKDGTIKLLDIIDSRVEPMKDRATINQEQISMNLEDVKDRWGWDESVEIIDERAPTFQKPDYKYSGEKIKLNDPVLRHEEMSELTTKIEAKNKKNLQKHFDYYLAEAYNDSQKMGTMVEMKDIVEKLKDSTGLSEKEIHALIYEAYVFKKIDLQPGKSKGNVIRVEDEFNSTGEKTFTWIQPREGKSMKELITRRAKQEFTEINTHGGSVVIKWIPCGANYKRPYAYAQTSVWDPAEKKVKSKHLGYIGKADYLDPTEKRSRLTKAELYEIAKEKDIPGRSKMNRKDLLRATRIFRIVNKRPLKPGYKRIVLIDKGIAIEITAKPRHQTRKGVMLDEAKKSQKIISDEDKEAGFAWVGDTKQDRLEYDLSHYEYLSKDEKRLVDKFKDEVYRAGKGAPGKRKGRGLAISSTAKKIARKNKITVIEAQTLMNQVEAQGGDPEAIDWDSADFGVYESAIEAYGEFKKGEEEGELEFYY